MLAMALLASVGLNLYFLTRPVAAPTPRTPAPSAEEPARPTTSATPDAPASRRPRALRRPAPAVAAPDYGTAPIQHADGVRTAGVDGRREVLPLIDIAHAEAMAHWQAELRELFGGPPAQQTPEQKARSMALHVGEARAAMDLDEGEAERYRAWLEESAGPIEALHRAGEHAAHLDALIDMFVAEERFLAAEVGPVRAGRYLDARAEHRVFVLVGVAAVADVDPYTALERYRRAGGTR